MFIKTKRNGMIKLRRAGTSEYPSWTLTVPAILYDELGNEIESGQVYTAHIDKSKRIVFTPIKG